MDDDKARAALNRLNNRVQYRAMGIVGSEGHKNLQSTGHASVIMQTDPNPKVISNSPKKRFSAAQRYYLKSGYFHWAVYGELSRDVVISAFEMKTNYNTKVTSRSAKRSAKNLAEYGYLTLSYEAPDNFNYYEDFDPHRYQPLLVATITPAGVEKGRELMEADGEPTDPEELQEISRRWRG
jgi:hypothetical protein